MAKDKFDIVIRFLERYCNKDANGKYGKVKESELGRIELFCSHSFSLSDTQELIDLVKSKYSTTVGDLDVEINYFENNSCWSRE